MTASARFATVATPPGPFTVVVTPGPDGGDVVLAAGWTDDVADLLPVVHRALRPTWVERAEHLPVLDAVEAHAAGDLGAIDAVPVRQRSGPFLEDAWEVLRTGGALGGFRWGLDVKRWLLDHEAEHAPVGV